LTPILLALGTAYALFVLRGEVGDKLLPLVPSVGATAWKDFRRLTVDQVVEMLSLRVYSLAVMAGSIFVKRIRALGYRMLYRNEKYERRRISNLVYHLKRDELFVDVLRGLVQEPSQKLRAVAEAAAAMPTALWFDAEKPYQLPSLVASGQATLCYNLMTYVRRFGASPSSSRRESRP